MSISSLSRREALGTLTRLAVGAASLPWLRPVALAAEAPAAGLSTSEPTGNAFIDKTLTGFEFAPLVTTKLTDSLAMLSGPGGNVAVLIGLNGALLVDTGVHPAAARLARGAEAFAGQVVKTVINTHWHFDHTGGNEFFGQRGCQIIAHENVRARLSQDQRTADFGFTFRAAPAPALPTLTFPEALTLYVGGETIQFHHVAPAHTDGDALVHFTRANVLHMGDTLSNGIYPYIDHGSLGWIGGLVVALDRGLELCDARTQIVPGHGPLASVADLKAARAMFATVQERIEKGLDAGKTVDEVVAAAPTREFDEQWGRGTMKGDQFARNAAVSILEHRQRGG